MGFVEKNGLRYFQFDSLRDQQVFHAVLTRHGGFSEHPFDSLNTGGTVGDDPQAVLKNHHLIYETFGYQFESRFDVWQVHGNHVVCTDVPRSVGTPHSRADGILTSQPDVTLFMRFADCVPILLFDPIRKVIGIIHAGWQGTYKRIARSAVEKMTKVYGSIPEMLLAGIGPSICQQCYQVGDDVRDAFDQAFGKTSDAYFHRQQGSQYLNLWQANRDILVETGVTQVEVAGICTACNLADWYSHRAEHGKTGRFAIMMSITDNGIKRMD